MKQKKKKKRKQINYSLNMGNNFGFMGPSPLYYNGERVLTPVYFFDAPIRWV
jgi:hypothetical protein